MHRTLSLLVVIGCVGEVGTMPDSGTAGGAATAGGSGTAGGAAGGTAGGSSGGSAGGSGGGGTIIVGSMGGPVLFFTDLVSGPSSGNGDTSRGTGGAVVTVWGRNLGASQGTSRLFLGAAEAAIYEWRNATGPADLFSRMGLQQVSFLVPATATPGSHALRAEVGGTGSNTLPFTVRSQGRILFVAPSGSDTAAGSFAAPWRTLTRAVDQAVPGDIIYARDGVAQSGLHEFRFNLNLNSDGTAALPKAVVAWPGATVNIGGNGHDPIGIFNGAGNKLAEHWVVSKLRLMGGGGTALPMYTGFRAVGNFVSVPDPDNNCQSGNISGEGDDLYVLGNQIADSARDNPTVSKLCHTIYLSGERRASGARAPTESNREVAWNYLVDNRDNRGINIYSEQPSAAFIEGHRIHDNVIVNHRGDGILIGYYVTGDNWIYNNVLINTGIGPGTWAGDISGQFAIQIGAGHESNRPTRLHVFNNTIYGGGLAGSADSTMLAYYPAGAVTFDFRNNIVVSPDVGYTQGNVPAQSGANLWFGRTGKPSWNAPGLSADPLFVDAGVGDLHLQAGSPAIDVGTPTPFPIDLEGLARPLGAGFDLGAYERVP